MSTHAPRPAARAPRAPSRHRPPARRRLLAFTAAMVAVLAPPALRAQDALQLATAPSPGRWLEAVEASRDVVVRRMAEVGIPGLSIAVAVKGEVVWEEGFGHADVENRVAVVAATRFRIASISKALTAAGVGVLVEQGRLDLDAPVQRYVPSFPGKRWPLTTRQVAGHVGGVRHYRGTEFESSVRYDDVVDALEIFAADTLLFEPGTRYSYSTYGWNLVSAVVQGAAGEPFLLFMRSRVLDPLGMHETVAEHVDSIIPFRARFYVRGGDGRLVNAPFVDNSNKWAGGGFLSTARDLVRYGASYLRHTLLQPATVEMLWTPQTTRDGQDTGYGIGWNAGVQDGVRTVWHTGGAMGGSTILMIQPDRDIVVAILTNVQNVGHVETARAVADRFFEVTGGASR